MANGVVVLKMALESPVVLERAQAQIAEELVAERVIDMVLQAVAVFEHAFA